MQIDGFWILECPACSHQFADHQPCPQHPQQVYDDQYFQGGENAGYADYLKDQDLLVQRGRNYGKLLHRYMAPGRVLDVGAAAGFILKGLTESGWSGRGVEPNPSMAKYAREAMHMDVLTTPMEAFHTEEQFDLITLIQVLPHFYDLNKSLEQLRSFTRPGGYWLIETWNKDSLTARLMGQHWHEYSPPSVLHWFAPSTLTRMAEKMGFTVVAKGRPQKKISGAHAKALVTYKLNGFATQTPVRQLIDLIPDRAVFPYPAEDLFWMLLQKKSVEP